MSNDYTPQVGDRVRRPDWIDREAATVTAVGEQTFLAKHKDSLVEYPYKYGEGYSWIKVEPPPTYPERWMNVYPSWVDAMAMACLTKSEADSRAYGNRIAVIHLASDGTTTLHPTTGEGEVIENQNPEVERLRAAGDALAVAYRKLGGLDVAFDAALTAWEALRREQ